jgi:hypothetical protein
MANIIRLLVIVLVVANAGAVFMANAGAAEVWGIEPQTGIGGAVDDARSDAQSISSGQVGVTDLGGSMVATVGYVTGLDNTIFAAPTLLSNLGVSGFIVDFAFGPLYVVVGFGLLSIIRGMDL